MKDEIKKDCCCHSHESNEKESGESCCHSKNDSESKGGKSCCHSHESNEKESGESCCHSKNDSESKGGESCCHSHESNEKESGESCCHSQGKEGISKNEKCSCEVKGEEVTGEGNCCCHTHESNEKESGESCCHSKNDSENKGGESCCHSHDKKEDSNNKSCCSHSNGGESAHGASCGCGAKGGVKNKWAKWIIMGVSLIATVISYINPFANHAILKYLDFGLIAVILCGYPLLLGAIDGFKNKRLTSAALMVLSIVACLVLQVLVYTHVLHSDGDHAHSYIFAAAEVAFLMAVGEMLEEFTIKKARSGLTKLFSLVPDNANLETPNGVKTVKCGELKIGDIIVVKPNEKIGGDGEIVEGESAIDQSIITGEATPVDVKAGSKVFGGTFNTFGLIKVKITKESREMAVEKLKNLVMEAEGKKAPISRVADRWASFIIPTALVVSVLVFLFNFFFLNKGDASLAIFSSVTVLVVFCPCALALATPTAIAAGLGALSSKGILVKSGGAIETLAKVKTVAFDKTGTITESSLSVTDIMSKNMVSSELGAFAAATESQNNHPIAKAITERFKSDMENKKISAVKSEVSVGVSAEVDGKKVEVKKWNAIDKNSKDFNEYSNKANEYFKDGKTVVAVVINGELEGIIALGAKMKEGVIGTVSALKDLGVKSVMLTGDNESAAKFTASLAGIDEHFSQLLPEEKLSKINALKADGKVCMVGDGVNDAPSLAASDCSIAMGALGSDLAIETADIALVGDDVGKISGLIKFSKRVYKTIIANMIVALSIAIIAVGVTFFNLLNPVTGALVHNLSTLLVVINSALLLKTNAFKNKKIN